MLPKLSNLTRSRKLYGTPSIVPILWWRRLTNSVRVTHLLSCGAWWTPRTPWLQSHVNAIRLHQSRCYERNASVRGGPHRQNLGVLPALRPVSLRGLQRFLWEKVIICMVWGSLHSPLSSSLEITCSLQEYRLGVRTAQRKITSSSSPRPAEGWSLIHWLYCLCWALTVVMMLQAKPLHED